MTPSAAPLVSFQNVLVVACELCPTIGIGTCWSCHCTVGCTPTWLMPVMITSGCCVLDLVEDRREVGGVRIEADVIEHLQAGFRQAFEIAARRAAWSRRRLRS